jgi:hypothetical protein
MESHDHAIRSRPRSWWTAKRIRDDIAPKVAADVAYHNAKENTPHTARRWCPNSVLVTNQEAEMEE